MSFMLFDLQQLYRQTFGGRPYQIGNEQGSPELTPFVIDGQNTSLTQVSGSQLVGDYLGKEIWLPIKFIGLDASLFGMSELMLPYSVIKISSKKTIVKTELAERKGTVKELFSVEDYNMQIKGFVIDESPNRIWPEQELITLRTLYELNEAVQLDNALTNIFLDKDQRVVIESLELPEVEGGRKHIRPFSMTLESDSIFTLELE